jgi:hypothetical protein
VESKKSIMSFFWENAFGSSLHWDLKMCNGDKYL